MFLMEDLTDLYDHIGYMILCAPDNFPYRDFLKPDQQMNMELGFKQLREGVLIAYPEQRYTDTKGTEARRKLYEILDESYKALNDGDGKKARKLLHDFQVEILGKEN